MAKKVYAIREGFDTNKGEKVENKIVDTWAECLLYVKGVKGAKYKSFESRKEAEDFLKEGDKLLRKGKDEYPQDCLHVYVDGSYNEDTSRYSYGLVAVRNNVVEYIKSGSEEDKYEKSIRQIAGELEGAVKGVEYALSKGDKKVVIIHDYVGICHHATGYWERKGESSVEYYNKMSKLINQGIEVVFVKVDAHTGDFFNELVDEKCKEQLSISSDKVVQKWLTENTLKVASDEVKEEILRLAPKGEDNVIVVNKEKEATEPVEKINVEPVDDFLLYIIEEYKKNPVFGERLIKTIASSEKDKLIQYLLQLNVELLGRLEK